MERKGEGETGRLGDWETGRLGDWEISCTRKNENLFIGLF